MEFWMFIWTYYHWLDIDILGCPNPDSLHEVFLVTILPIGLHGIFVAVEILNKMEHVQNRKHQLVNSFKSLIQMEFRIHICIKM